MNRRLPSSALFLALLFAAVSPFPVAAQGREASHRPVPSPARQQQQSNQATGKHGQKNEFKGLPPKWVNQLQEMSPDEQQRFLNNNEHFRHLSPQRQAQIRERLRNWNSMTPDEREALRDRQRVWEQLTPQERDHIQHDLLPKWRDLPASRKQLIQSRLRSLNGLSSTERTAKLNDPEFMQGLSPDEQDMLRSLSVLRTPKGEQITPPSGPGSDNTEP